MIPVFEFLLAAQRVRQAAAARPAANHNARNFKTPNLKPKTGIFATLVPFPVPTVGLYTFLVKFQAFKSLESKVSK